MLRVQERSGAPVVTHSLINTWDGREARNQTRWRNTCHTESCKAAKPAPGPVGGQKQLSDKAHRESGSLRGISAQQRPQEDGWQWWVLAPGDTLHECPPSEAGCEGMCLAPFTALLEMTEGSQGRGTIALYCGQQLAMAATLKGCKSACIIIPWFSMLTTSHIWSPENNLPLIFYINFWGGRNSFHKKLLTFVLWVKMSG